MPAGHFASRGRYVRNIRACAEKYSPTIPYVSQEVLDNWRKERERRKQWRREHGLPDTELMN
jgi:hypothetical protein